MKFLKELWCRIAYGHIMVSYWTGRGCINGQDSQLIDHRMCARCLRTETLYYIS